MWDAYLKHIDIVKHCIKRLILDTAPIPSVPYWEAPKTQKNEKAEINKMPPNSFTDPA